MAKVAIKDLLDYDLGRAFTYSSHVMGTPCYTEGTIVSVEKSVSEYGFGDHLVTYKDEDGGTADFFAFGTDEFEILD